LHCTPEHRRLLSKNTTPPKTPRDFNHGHMISGRKLIHNCVSGVASLAFRFAPDHFEVYNPQSPYSLPTDFLFRLLRAQAMSIDAHSSQIIPRRTAMFQAVCGSLAFCSLGRALVRAQEDTLNSKIRDAIQGFVTQKEIPGAVAMVVDKERVLQVASAGFANLETKETLSPENLFWIASMSKPITAICVMMLVDEGKLSLDDPIAKYLPEMRGMKTESGESVSISILQTLNHTSGMRELPAPYSDTSLSEAAEKYAALPVHFSPGSKWQYSQTGINTAARIVEVVSQMTFDTFVQKRLCEPLELTDTTFYLSAMQNKRLAKSYTRTAEGELKESPIFLLAGKEPTDKNRLPAANGGLFSTPGDYGRICQMLLSNGSWSGKRLLSESSVHALATPTTGSLTTGFTNGNAWGIGCCVVQDPQGPTAMLSKGTYGHGGAYGTQAWIDPVRGRAYLLFVQRANFPNADASDLRLAFQKLATQ
jgi:CubicO group peptidase (beta-lactamase class C family)